MKILGEGELTKKLVVKASAFSASAKEKIEKAGGTAEVVRVQARQEAAAAAAAHGWVPMASGFQNIGKIPELRRRILFTLTLLAVYRIGAFVTTPGVNRAIMAKIVNQASGTFLGLFNMFSGGALEQMSIFALGIMPYISASIILQLLTVVIPKLEQIQKEGETGRRRINQYTRYGCVILSLIQSFFIARWLEGNNRAYAQFGQVVTDPGWTFRLLTMISLTTGTAFIMWLGEQITERGIGNGISLIIFAGIVTDMPDAAVRMFSKAKTGDITAFDLAVIGLVIVVVVAVIIFFERGQRRIPVQYAKRVVGRKMCGGQSSHLPLKVNTAGVIPPIFASSILMFPAADRVVRADALDAADLGGPAPGRLALQPDLRRAHRLLLLLLHGRHVQPGRRRRQHEEVRRLHPRHPARPRHRRVHQQGADPHHLRRRRLHLGRSACCRRCCTRR